MKSTISKWFLETVKGFLLTCLGVICLVLIVGFWVGAAFGIAHFVDTIGAVMLVLYIPYFFFLYVFLSFLDNNK